MAQVGSRRSLLRAAAVLVAVLVCGCGPRVDLRSSTTRIPPEAQDDPFVVSVQIVAAGFAVSLTNRSDAPIEALWHKASIVDSDGIALEIARDGGRSAGSARDLSGDDVSVIPARSTFVEYVQAKKRISFSPGAGWDTRPLISIECGPVRCVGFEELVGRQYRLSLPIRAGGREQLFEWTVRITDAIYSTRATRDSD